MQRTPSPDSEGPLYWCEDDGLIFPESDFARHARHLTMPAAKARKTFSRPITEQGDRRGATLLRHSTSLKGVDRVFGGGLVRGTVSLFTGEPGIGKSTLLLGLLGLLAKAGARVLYASAEERDAQIKARAERIHALHPRLHLLADNKSMELVRRDATLFKPHVIVVDSLQRMHALAPTAGGGPHAEILAVASACVGLAQSKELGYPAVFLIGHVNADLDPAGPIGARHDIDAHFELHHDANGGIVMSVRKNRNGSREEIVLLRFQGGRLVEVEDLSTELLTGVRGTCGVVPLPTAHLAHVLTLPVEAAVSSERSEGESGGGRIWRGIGVPNELLRDVLDALREHGVSFHRRDVRVAVPRLGARNTDDEGLDLAIAVAVTLGAQQRSLPMDVTFFGKIALSGAIRPVPRIYDRLAACNELGLRRVFGPECANLECPKGLHYTPLPTLQEALNLLQGVSVQNSSSDLKKIREVKLSKPT